MKRQTKILVLVILLVFIMLSLFGVYWINKLQIAHSTFENYYSFRGCSELINKTDDYGFCRINSGEIIKIVRFNNKWYLEGDLPSGFLDW